MFDRVLNTPLLYVFKTELQIFENINFLSSATQFSCFLFAFLHSRQSKSTRAFFASVKLRFLSKLFTNMSFLICKFAGTLTVRACSLFVNSNTF